MPRSTDSTGVEWRRQAWSGGVAHGAPRQGGGGSDGRAGGRDVQAAVLANITHRKARNEADVARCGS